MRQVICLAVLLTGFALFTSCDSSQPQEVGEQFMQIEIAAGNASIQVFDVWEQYFDMNNDGVPDETDPSGVLLESPVEIACRKATRSDGDDILASGFTPWNYSLEISIIRAGTTVTERLTTSDALLSTFNMTEYATNTINGMQQPGSDCPVFAICNPIGRLPGTHRIVIDSTYDGGTDSLFCPGSPGLGLGRMGGTPGAPGPIPFSLTVNKGDTILVEARKNFSAPEGIILLSEPTLQGTVFLGGSQIQNLNGTSVSRSEPRAGISFSFTVN